MSTPFRCLVCREGDSIPALTDCTDYYLGKPQRADYVRCRACGMLQQFPVPSDLGALYDEYPVHSRKSRLHDFMRSLVMGPVYFDAGTQPEGSVLIDYGCGDGSYLDANRKKHLTLIGYELDPAHAARVSDRLRLPVFSDKQALLDEFAGKADAVTMHFVLEHLPDLDSGFDEVHRLLKPGGVFYFIVPHASSLEARLFKKKWHNLDPPRHISFPEKSAVDLLAGRHGFTLLDEKPIPFPNGVAGSLPVVFSGRFRFSLFLLFLPLGILFSRLVPTGSHGYWLVRNT